MRNRIVASIATSMVDFYLREERASELMVASRR